MLKIYPAETDKDLEQVRILFQEYADFLKQILSEYLTLKWFTDYLKGFEKESANLPGNYAPPTGCLLLAKYKDQPAGCVALRKFSDDICVMKRLYIRPKYQRKGIGTALYEALMDQAKKVGYTHMRLATALEPAKALYKSIGFKEIEPYRDVPIANVVFMELKLE